jgi:hypothetical protein
LLSTRVDDEEREKQNEYVVTKNEHSDGHGIITQNGRFVKPARLDVLCAGAMLTRIQIASIVPFPVPYGVMVRTGGIGSATSYSHAGLLCLEQTKKITPTLTTRTLASIAALLIVVTYCFVGSTNAQHIELGGFADYSNTNISTFPHNALGLGGRVDFNLHRLLQAEFESAYDFKYTSVVLATSSASAALTSSELGILHVNGGLKLQTRGGSFFLFAKGGVNRYDPVRTITTITGLPIVSSTTPASPNVFTENVFYPGCGIGFHAGHLAFVWTLATKFIGAMARTVLFAPRSVPHSGSEKGKKLLDQSFIPRSCRQSGGVCTTTESRDG